MDNVRMLSAGEQGLVVEFGTQIDPAVNARVHRVSKMLSAAKLDGISEVVPTYRSLLVYFDPLQLSRQELVRRIEEFLAAGPAGQEEQAAARVVDIPVCYGGDFGPDIEFVMRHTGFSADEVVRIHTSVPYLVYMLGFVPGFAYLGGLDERLATPRLEKPRTAIPVGSVGIAGTQTGFYPIESPGGWQLIGRTPIKAFHPAAADPFLFAAGDYLRFRAISPGEFAAIEAEVAAGTYRPKIETMTAKDGDKQ
ncbi:MAG: 5-oxoprolinase subunit PxpB [Negativicutes bacterium]|nr:5-oxoprolinase subunit PxpB [Negativicutes bacterium]